MEGIYGKMFRLIIRIHNFPGNGSGYSPYGRSIEADLRIRRNGPAVCRIVFTQPASATLAATANSNVFS